jgi:hypothetical protein
LERVSDVFRVPAQAKLAGYSAIYPHSGLLRGRGPDRRYSVPGVENQKGPEGGMSSDVAASVRIDVWMLGCKNQPK